MCDVIAVLQTIVVRTSRLEAIGQEKCAYWYRGTCPQLLLWCLSRPHRRGTNNNVGFQGVGTSAT